MKKLITSKKSSFSFAAAVGTGMTAKAAEKGGAEFLLLINAGRLRMRGAPSLSCYLPLENVNSWIANIGKTEVLNRCEIPVLMGCSVANPQENINDIITLAKESGFTGVTNFPSACLIDGEIREVLELQNMGFEKECELIEIASKQGLQTLAYVTNNDEALQMAAAGASRLCINIGFTNSSSVEPSNLTVDNTVKIIDRALRNIPDHISTYVEGGPITTPESALAICSKSRVQGYIAGSTIDRFPLEEAIINIAKSYRVISNIEDVDSIIQESSYIFGTSKKMSQIKKMVEQFATLNTPILITGPSGSGKGALVEEIHQRSDKHRNKIIHIDCLNLALEGGLEFLFGSVAGYQGKNSASKIGVLEYVNNTTIHFEEISALDHETQTKLINFFDTGTVRRLGDDKHHQVNCRIISSTREPIDQLLKKGILIEELYYRLSALYISIPALNKRTEDIPFLAKKFIADMKNSQAQKISNSGLSALMEYDWPGNIREFKNALTRACLLSHSKTLKSSDFNFLKELLITNSIDEASVVSQKSLDKESLCSQPLTEKDWITETLQRNRFKRGPTATELGITTRTLYSKIKKYNIYSP
ncbi:MAG: hypothetical protein OFPI_07360 [Osedax symbiont Rs2]|nr:MAG: hypothetical protein OFPI_07360 [Osedax symbiont Rs2]